LVSGGRIRQIVALSGPPYSGKTTLAQPLATSLNGYCVSARDAIVAASGAKDRKALQDAGRGLEEGSPGVWLAEAVPLTPYTTVVVDSVRTAPQLFALRQIATTAIIYLSAEEAVRRARFTSRRDPADAALDFEALVAGELATLADISSAAGLIVKTDDLSIEDVRQRVLDYVAGCLSGSEAPRKSSD
jgi:cytidylate kinase